MLNSSVLNSSALYRQAGDLGDGRIDNFIVSSSVHVATGVVVLVSMILSSVLVGRHVLRNEPVDSRTRAVLVVTQLALGVQVLLGIKLLDQGQGIVQLYIHYVGGLIPLGAFLAAGWFARGDTPRTARVLAVLLVVGSVSAFMAFFIGRAFANA